MTNLSIWCPTLSGFGTDALFDLLSQSIDWSCLRRKWSQRTLRRIGRAQKHASIKKNTAKKILFERVTQPVQTERVAPILFALNENYFLLFFDDHRKWNTFYNAEAQILRMDECIDSIGWVVVFSTLVASSGFEQVQIENQDQEKTAFIPLHGLHPFVWTPFGLMNTLRTF